MRSGYRISLCSGYLKLRKVEVKLKNSCGRFCIKCSEGKTEDELREIHKTFWARLANEV